jgi:hypothetical protein
MISAIGIGMDGMARASAQLERGAARTVQGDPVGGAVDQAVAVATFRASEQVVRTDGELIGALLHVIA